MTASLRRLLIYTTGVFTVSVAYFAYAFFQIPQPAERETFLSEIGESFGEIALWALGFIYLRTLLKLLMGRGPLSKRLLPDYSPLPSAPALVRFIAFLDKTHVHVGIASVAIILLHTVLMGMPMSNLFFPAVIALVIWQMVFGMIIRWRTGPRDIKKFSYSVHAQLITGVMMGVFAYFGHMLVDG